MRILKKLFIAILIIAGIAGAYILYHAYNYYSEAKPLEELIAGTDVTTILMVVDPLQTFNDIQEADLWESFSNVDEVLKAKNQLDHIRHLIETNTALSFMAPFLSSEVYMIGRDADDNTIFAANLGFKLHLLESTGLFSLLKGQIQNLGNSEYYPGVGTIHTITIPGEATRFYFLIKHGYGFIGFAANDIVNALSGVPMLSENNTYNSLAKQLNRTALVSGVLLHKQEAADATSSFFNSLMGISKGFSFSAAAEERNLILSGQIKLTDSTGHVLSELVNTDPIVSGNLAYIPNGVAGFVQLNIGSFTELFNATVENLKTDPKLYREFVASRKVIEEDLAIDIRQDLASWIGHEITLITLTPSTYRSAAEKAVIISTRDRMMSMDAMGRVRNAIEAAFPINFDSENYRGYNIFRLRLPFFLNVFFGQLFDDMPKPFYTFIDDRFILADQEETIKFIIDAHNKQQSIKTDPVYKNAADVLQSTQNAIIYANMGKGFDIAREMFNNEYYSVFKQAENYLENAESAIVEITKNKIGMMDYFSRIHFVKAAANKLQVVWQKELPSKFKFQPLPKTNNGNEAPSFSIFGENGFVYHLDYFGQEVGPRSTQLARRFYSQPIVLKINGKRFLALSTGNEMRLYNTDLSLFAGYKSRDIISTPPVATANDKWLFFTDWSGMVYQYDYERSQPNSTLLLNGLNKSGLQFVEDSFSEMITATADGTIYQLRDSSGLQTDSLVTIRQAISAPAAELNWDGKTYFIYGTWSGLVHAYDLQLRQRPSFPLQVSGRIKARIGTIYRDDEAYIIVPTTSKLIYLYDQDGNLRDNWPVRTYGALSSKPLAHDVNGDGEEDIVALADDGRLYAFTQRGEIIEGWPVIASANPLFFAYKDKRHMLVLDWNQKASLYLLPSVIE
jgi:hypothetical protein